MARAFLRALMMTAAVTAAVTAPVPAGADPGTPASPSFPAFVGPPWLGVSMDAGGDIGVTVEHVVRGSPADKGGLHAGDRIDELARAAGDESGGSQVGLARHCQA